MDLMDRIARRHKLRVYSTKNHLQVSTAAESTTTGVWVLIPVKTLLSPGKTPKNNIVIPDFFVNV
jgi:glutamine synthetase